MSDRLNLNRPLCFFDIEATGVNPSQDRIVELHILKVLPDMTKESKTWRINPTIPISKEAFEVHHISDEDVADMPTFKEIAPQIAAMISGADLAGFNSQRFDLPMLSEEFLRANFEDIDLKKSKSIDVQVIYHKNEKRTLEAAYRFYCGKNLTNAHQAQGDVQATYEVFLQQLERYKDLPNDMDELSMYATQREAADFAGFLTYDDQRNITVNFGKHKGKTLVWLFQNDRGYLGWILKSEFPLYTKKVIRDFQKESRQGKHTTKL